MVNPSDQPVRPQEQPVDSQEPALPEMFNTRVPLGDDEEEGHADCWTPEPDEQEAP